MENGLVLEVLKLHLLYLQVKIFKCILSMTCILFTLFTLELN